MRKKDSYFYLRNGYVIEKIFLQTASTLHDDNVTCVHDILYSRTTINLCAAIYELERAVHDQRSEYYLFAEMCVGTFLIMVVRLSIVGVVYS